MSKNRNREDSPLIIKNSYFSENENNLKQYIKYASLSRICFINCSFENMFSPGVIGSCSFENCKFINFNATKCLFSNCSQGFEFSPLSAVWSLQAFGGLLAAGYESGLVRLWTPLQ